MTELMNIFPTPQSNSENVQFTNYFSPNNSGYYVEPYMRGYTEWDAKADAEIRKHYAKRDIDLSYERARLEGLQKYRLKKEYQRLVILLNQDQRYIYYIGTEDNPGPLFELLPNVKLIKSTIYFCQRVDIPIFEIFVEMADQKSSICLVWDENIVKKICRWFVKEAVIINLPTKRKKEAIEKLLPLLKRDAKRIQLPERHGWQKDMNGDFIFVCPESMSYMEVFKDAK